MGWVNDARKGLVAGRSVQVRPVGGSMRGRIESGQLATLGDDTTTLINPGRLVGLTDAVVATLNECLRVQSLHTTLAAAEIAGNYLLLVGR